jgi:hypothetical protein
MDIAHDDQNDWLRPALLIEHFSSGTPSFTFNHVERIVSSSGMHWQKSKLDRSIYINDEDLELHPPLVELRRRLGMETHRSVAIPNGRAFLLTADEWSGVVEPYRLEKRFLDPLRLWQRAHEQRRLEYAQWHERMPSMIPDDFPSFEQAFQASLEKARTTRQRVHVSGSCGNFGEPPSTLIYMLPDGSLEEEGTGMGGT